MIFNMKRLLEENFTTPEGVVNLVSAYNLDAPSVEAVKKWFYRASIPSEWLPVLSYILEMENGETFRLSRYLEAGR